MQCKRKSKGITLVSLVITIVLMLILASVSISAILNNDGLFSRTTLSTREYKKENIIEIVKMAEIQLDLDRSKDETIERNISNLIKIVKETSEIKNENYIVTVDDVEQTATIIDKKILDFDNNGHMEIVCYNGPILKLSGRSDYMNAIKILNDKAVPYGGGTYGYSTRHLGSNPNNPESYAVITSLTDTNQRRQTHHESDVNGIVSFSGVKLAGNRSWLASREFYSLGGYGYYRVRVIQNDGALSISNIYRVKSSNSTSSNYMGECSIAPVVSLESGVKINTSLSGNGSESNPWKLIK